MKTYVHFLSQVADSSLNNKCFKQKLQRISKHTFCVRYLFSENRIVYEIMWKNRAGQDTDDDTVYAPSMLVT